MLGLYFSTRFVMVKQTRINFLPPLPNFVELKKNRAVYGIEENLGGTQHEPKN